MRRTSAPFEEATSPAGWRAPDAYSFLREKIAAEREVRRERNAKFATAYANAVAAGKAAGEAITPHPMTVVGQIGPDAGHRYHVPEGVCGFAWVRVRPGNSAFARWLVKLNLARSAYRGGVDIWISDYNQSMERKEAHARAMAEVLRTELGVQAYADSRMD